MYANVPSSKGSGDSSDKNTGQIFSYEIRLVLEYCDLGCLRDALDVKAFANDQGFNFPAILDTALDIARAMHHLHVSNVLHMDLKPRNIMIKSSGAGQGGGRGLTAKVADFGLSVSLDSNQTHASSIYQGTITHMAPEVLMNGRVSKAADVYSFGILLWELYTGGTAFSNIPGPHIGHAITTGKRPIFSLATPPAYQLLAETCWSPDPEARPTFPQIIQCLQSIKLGQPATLALDISWLKEEMAKLKGRPIKGKSPVESGSKLIPVGQARGQPRISRKARGGQVSMRYGHMPAGTGIVIVGGAGFSNQSSEGSVSESYSSLGLGKPLERVLEVRESMDESVQGSGDGISFAREASSRASRSRADMIDEGQEIG